MFKSRMVTKSEKARVQQEQRTSLSLLSKTILTTRETIDTGSWTLDEKQVMIESITKLEEIHQRHEKIWRQNIRTITVK